MFIVQDIKNTVYSPKIKKDDNNNWVHKVPRYNKKILEVVEFTRYNDNIIEHHTSQRKLSQENVYHT
jgi:hypothetical protein